MIRISQLKIKSGLVLEAKEKGREALEELLAKKAADALRIDRGELKRITVCRESVDARKKPELFYIYTVEVALADGRRKAKIQAGLQRNVKRGGAQISLSDPVTYRLPESGERKLRAPVVIVGTGPAGLFCGYFLALKGYRPILLERGKTVEERTEDVKRFWESGVLDTVSNVQFGEGGAGTFSDGKLNTLVKDKYGRNTAVLQTFAEFGAGEEILCEAKPHVGTDVLMHIVKAMREKIKELGGQVRFETKVTDIEIKEGKVCGVVTALGEKLPCACLVLACGHSARDTFEMLYEKKIPMETKSFAVGLRVEHPQSMINKSQYGVEDAGGLGAAPYKVAAQAANGRGVYSFCMCPGGYVVNASSEEGRLAVNGMSYSARDGKNANSAVIVAVTPVDFGSEHPLAGVEFQRRLEERAFALAKGKIPMQRYGVFKACVDSGKSQEELGRPINIDTGMFLEDNQGCGFAPEHKGESVWADLSGILPEACNLAFVEGMEQFGRQIEGFNRPDAILSGVESRTSSPVRIPRDETLQSEVKGLYPCGEGAGYAGGITSAAMDGLKIAEQIIATYAVPAEES